MDKNELRIVFMGTPDFAVSSLKRLVDGGYHVVAVITQPDRPVGRHGSVLQPSAVKVFAQEHAIPVLQPERMKDETFLTELRSFKADLQVVVAFRMLPEVVWAMPRFGTFNVHASLLPQYRGAAPINWAVINGETITGVTTFFLDRQIDTGRIIMQKHFDIPNDANAEYVHDGLMNLGAVACQETVDLILSTGGQVQSVPQQESSDLKVAPKLFKENCEINWQLSAKHVYDFVRGLSPSPGAWCHFEGSTMKIYKTRMTGISCHEMPGTMKTENGLLVATGDEWLEITELQLAGKKRMNARDFLNGFRK